MSEDFKAPALTDNQKQVFQNMLSGASNVVLMSGFFQDRPVALICEISGDEHNVDIIPIGLLFDEQFLKGNCHELKNADGESLPEPRDEPEPDPYTYFEVNGIEYRAVYNQGRDALLYELVSEGHWTLRGAFETIQRAKESVGWKFEDDDEPSLMEQFEVHDQLDALAGDASENGFEIGMRCGMCNMLMDHCRCPD